MYSKGGNATSQKPLACLVLEASYEATLWAAVIHAVKHKDDPKARVVLLTLIGGGVFGNHISWISTAIEKAFNKIKQAGVALDVRIVNYSGVDHQLKELEQKFE
jgi:hypothetical protein